MYLLIVTGMSGAGKTHALKRLEDMGFFCVDNLPFDMIPGFLQLCEKAATPITRAVVGIDSRASKLDVNIRRQLDTLRESGVNYEVIYLDCRDDILERRYHETRRAHPMGNDIKRGIARERELLAPLRHIAKYIIDTSDLKPMELLRRLEDILGDCGEDAFILTIESFGYKYGIPMESDYVFDMRFTDNPFYEPALKPLSGLDTEVRDYVMADPDFCYLLDMAEQLLKHLIPRYLEQGKHRLMVAFGCTGGRHRSVCAAQEIYTRMRDVYKTQLIHRDAVVEQQSIQER